MKSNPRMSRPVLSTADPTVPVEHSGTGTPGPSRRAILHGTAGVVAGAALVAGATTGASAAPLTPPGRTRARPARGMFAELDHYVDKLMRTYEVPGAALGVWWRGHEHIRGFGVTNLDDPQPVDGDTLFRIGSTTKTFTGTIIMRLVEHGTIDLDARVHTYLPEFRTSVPSVARHVTVRQLLNHTPGWLGDYFVDYGRGANALADYVAGVARIPQLTPVGTTFAYNNTGIGVAGRIIEKVTGGSYEDAARSLLLDPLQLAHTGFFADELIGYRIAAPHDYTSATAQSPAKSTMNRADFYLPRSLDSIGGLLSSARDQITWARFHMGDGRAPDGKRLLTRSSLREMRTHPGPGGTLEMELTGMGVTWQIRPTAEGIPIIQHGGAWAGYLSGFYFVPQRDFAITLLTNTSNGFPSMHLTNDDWVLERFTGLHNPPAKPRALPARQLRSYVGHYTDEEIDGTGGNPVTTTGTITLAADHGRLRYRTVSPEGDELQPATGTPATLAFYRDDYVRVYDSDGRDVPLRADFIRDTHGHVTWFRFGGRLYRRVS